MRREPSWTPPIAIRPSTCGARSPTISTTSVASIPPSSPKPPPHGPATRTPNTAWVLRHGLRTLIKRADSTALALVGFTGDSLHVARPRISGHVVPWEGDLIFTAVVTNDGETDATVAIDYSIGFRRANGSVSAKTFKLGKRRIAAGGSAVVTKTHSFRPITTRTYYPGPHYVTVQANGVLSSPQGFVLGRADEKENGDGDAHRGLRRA